MFDGKFRSALTFFLGPRTISTGTRYLETRTQTYQHTFLFTIENAAAETRTPQYQHTSLEAKHISTLFYSPLKVQLQKLVKSQYGAPHSFSTVNICREVC